MIREGREGDREGEETHNRVRTRRQRRGKEVAQPNTRTDDEEDVRWLLGVQSTRRPLGDALREPTTRHSAKTTSSCVGFSWETGHRHLTAIRLLMGTEDA